MSTARPGRCPDCRKHARRVHSAYQRSLEERPLGSRRVVVRLRVRRYFCDRKWCFRKTFVEQVPGLSERYRRSRTGLTAGCGRSQPSWAAVRPHGYAGVFGWPPAAPG
ncbi:transposase family protein [Streptomyces europaeiscabiei]|uniref:transposase family protein n=1 Tax=Streptomyces europaeiscabiei TaxID=146819 RepID=UPI0038D3D290